MARSYVYDGTNWIKEDEILPPLQEYTTKVALSITPPAMLVAEYEDGYGWDALYSAYQDGKKLSVEINTEALSELELIDGRTIRAEINELKEDTLHAIVLFRTRDDGINIDSAELIFYSDGLIAFENYRSLAFRSELDARYIPYDNDTSGLDSITVQDAIDELAEEKQDNLVSGTNIKTINNQSILGSGNIEVQGGGASSADEVSYENASSGLSAENVQDAIDELADEKVDKEAGKGLFSGSYDDLTNRPQIPSIPSGTNNGDILLWNGTEWAARKNRLPVTYQEVEYISSDGNQYITVTNKFSYTPYTRIYVDFQLNSLPSENSAYILIGGGWGDGLFLAAAKTSSFRYAVKTRNDIGYVDLNRHSYDLASGIQKFDGEIVSSYEYTTTFSTKLNLFDFDNYSVPSTVANSKIYEVIIYEQDTEKYHFVPCYNKVTNEIGMYEAVEGKFYGNSGSGTFLKGADV